MRACFVAQPPGNCGCDPELFTSRRTTVVCTTQRPGVQAHWCTSLVMATPRRRWAFMAACSRGTGTSTFDYARFSVSVLGYEHPLILCIGPRDDPVENLFRHQFGNESVVLLKHWPTPKKLDPLLLQHGVSDLYMQKWGTRDATRSNLSSVRNIVHVSGASNPPHSTALTRTSARSACVLQAVFDAREPHGDAFAKVGPSILGEAPVVPYIVPRALLERGTYPLPKARC